MDTYLCQLGMQPNQPKGAQAPHLKRIKNVSRTLSN
jgi:hypothetical protein